MVDSSQLAEAMPQFVWIAQPDGRIVYFNRPWIDYTGVDVHDADDVVTNGVVHPDDIDSTVRRWNAALAEQTPFEVEYRLRRAHDHSYRWFIARAVPIFADGGELERWIGTATDIDAQKRANINLHFLLDATSQFSPPLGEADIAQRLADLAVMRHADWSVVYFGDAERLEVAALAHRDPAQVERVEQYRSQPIPGIGDELTRVVTENRPMVYSSFDAKGVDSDSHPPINSALVAPIATDEGKVLGAVVFVSSWWRYGESDLDIAIAVARRAALALQNARVIEAERRTSGLLRFVTRAGELLFEDFDVTAAFERLCQYAVREIADLALVIQRVEGRGKRVLCAAGRTIDLDYHASALVGERFGRPSLEGAFLQRLRRAAPYLIRNYDTARVAPGLWEYIVPHLRALHPDSAVTIPLTLRGDVYGAIILATCGMTDPFVESDLSAFGELARSAAIAVGQSESFARERRIATELQHAMLPHEASLPNVDGIRLSAMYRPSSADADIGGDWYDAVSMPDGSLVLTVGDVTGRGLEAAGLMGQLRQAFSVVALYEADPARILDSVDLLMRQRGSPAIATAFIGIIDPQRKTLRYANAGHPYALLRRGGEIVELRAFGLPLGLRDRGVSEKSHAMRLDGSELLVLYTDGLVESTHNLIEGERRLHEVLRSDAVRFVSNPAEFICSACVGAYAPDDTAVVTASFGSQRTWSFDAENAQAAHDARGEFIAHLRAQVKGGDLMAAELVFGELIGNVVRHAPGPIEIQLEWTGEHPVLHVTDRGTGFNRTPSLPDDMLVESGRGLYIIETLSRAVNVEYIPGYGTHAAVTLPVTRA